MVLYRVEVFKASPETVSFVFLGGSWVVINGLISRPISVISIVNLLIALLITTHEPPSMPGPKS